MQFRKTVVRLFILFFPFQSFAQSSNLPQGSKHDHFLDRLEILVQDNPDLNFSAIKPMRRRPLVKAAEMADSIEKRYPYDFYYHLSEADRYNLQSFRMNNSEWASGDQSSFTSKKPLFGVFYKTKAN